MRALGLPISDDVLLTPNAIAADLMVRRAVKSVLVLGTSGVGNALAESGFDIVFTDNQRAEHVDAVYIAWHPECNMKDIETACKASGTALSSTWRPMSLSSPPQAASRWDILMPSPLLSGK